jgi:hypothetical protein
MNMKGFVYAIGDNDRVKIGWSEDPIRRLNKIRSDCPDVAHLLGLIPATRQQEAEAHKLLARWCIQREWFRRDGAVAAFVNMLPRPEPRFVDVHPSDHPLRKWRIANKKNRDDLASALGVSGVTVWRWEAHRQFPERQFWKPIERVTGISVVDLATASRDAAESDDGEGRA